MTLQVTPAGGLFKSTVDPNITVYFPVKAIDDNITILMQVYQTFTLTAISHWTAVVTWRYLYHTHRMFLPDTDRED